MMSDEKILEGIISGKVSAYEILFRKHYSRVKNFICMIVKDKDLAEDIAQDVFMKIWIGRASLSADKSLRNLLFVMARNGAVNALKSMRNRTGTATMEEAETVGGGENDKVLFNETEMLINSGIARMPAQRRQIFVMSRYRNMSNKEIADCLNLSVRTVEKHIQLALKDLRESLD